MREVQAEAKTVQIAVEKALKDLALRRDQVEVVVLDEGSGGFLGIGAKPACVVVREKKWTGETAEGKTPRAPESARPVLQEKPRQFRNSAPQNRQGGERGKSRDRFKSQRRSDPAPRATKQETAPAPSPAAYISAPTAPIAPIASTATIAPSAAQQPVLPEEMSCQVPDDMKAAAEQARSVLAEMLKLLGVSVVSIKVRWDAPQARIYIDFESGDSGLLIGSEGKTIEALQYLVTLILSRKNNRPMAVQIDTKGYWQRVETGVTAELDRAVESVKKTGRVYRLEPMSPALRRFVHRYVSAHPEVESASEGEGKWRKVVLKLRQKTENREQMTENR